jgi:FixJ family two-component response regulator
MLKGIERLLRVHGYDCRSFPSAEALEKNVHDLVHALGIILDIDPNGSSGIKLRYRLKDAGVSVPVIYITGNDSPGIRDAALKSGCIAYLKKPFSMQALLQPLRERQQ